MSKSVKINCSNIGQSRLFPIGVSLMEISEILQEEKGLDFEPIAALVNHKSENLNTELYHPALVEFIDIRHAEGMRVYTRTLSFLIAAVLLLHSTHEHAKITISVSAAMNTQK